MTHWLIPANTKIYDVLSAFKHDETYWPVNANITVGDTVFIYLTAPYKQIGFVCEVMATGTNMNEILDHVLPFLKGKTAKREHPKPFMKLKSSKSILIEENGLLSLNQLRQNGLKGMLMGARKLENNPELFGYIRKNLS